MGLRGEEEKMQEADGEKCRGGGDEKQEADEGEMRRTGGIAANLLDL